MIENPIQEIKSYYDNDEELREAIEDGSIEDTILEIADNSVDVYNYDLLEWFKDNYFKVEEAIEEFGFPETEGKPDIMKAIMSGQFLENEQVLNEALDEIKEELNIETSF